MRSPGTTSRPCRHAAAQGCSALGHVLQGTRPSRHTALLQRRAAVEEHPKAPVCLPQVVGAVGWNSERLPIPTECSEGMQQLIGACFGEPQGRPTFRWAWRWGPSACLHAAVRRPAPQLLF